MAARKREAGQREPQAFHRLYFDSNVLIRAQWPTGSAELHNLATLARDVNVELFLPEPVAQELEEHWIRQFREACNRASSGVGEVVKRVAPVSEHRPTLALPDEAAVLADYCRAVDDLRGKLNLRLSPATTRPTAVFFDLAVRHAPPFGEKGRGFQDAVILFSVADHLRAAEGAVAVGALLTADEMLAHPEARRLARQEGVTIEVFEEMEQVIRLLTGRLAVTQREGWEQDCRAAEAALNAMMPQIQEFVAQNLGVSERELGLLSRLVTVRELEIQRLLTVRTPFPPDRVEGQQVPISFDLEVTVATVVERPPFDPLEPLERLLRPPPRIRKGEIAPQPTFGETSHWWSRVGSTAGPELVEQRVRTIVEVEASATFRGGQYTDVALCAVRLKPPPGLSAALGDLPEWAIGPPR